jgi:hypothetical protein
MGFCFRIVLIAACFGAAAPAYAQVRVITRDTEHIYGYGGQLLDDNELRAKNERAERATIERQREREIARQQEELWAAEQARQAAQAAPIYYDSEQVESYGFVGGHVRSGRHGHAGVRRRR